MNRPKIQYHPAFASGLELVFWQYLTSLLIETEHELSRKPLKMDVLIVKKREDIEIGNEIGQIFRKHNIIEYKGPGDELSIDDYCKVMAYAFLYKSLGKGVNEIPIDQITVSIFRHAYPRELFRHLRENGCRMERTAEGVYAVSGRLAPFPTQVVVMRELSSKDYAVLRILAPGASEEDIRTFGLETGRQDDAVFRRNADAVLQVSITANRAAYEKLGREDPAMCDALRDLMKEDFVKERAEGRAEGRADLLVSLVEKGRISPEEAAEELGITTVEFKEKYLSSLV